MTTMNVAANPGYLAMPDNVNVNLLPAGYPAYLGYVDGEFQTASALQGMFPEAQIVLLTVKGGPAAHGVRVAPGGDVEPGDMTAAAAAAWTRAQLNVSPLLRPVLYASVIGKPGYGMTDVVRALTAERVSLSRVRLLSAHYGHGPHVCGPRSCGAIQWDMDGTQWTSEFAVPGGFVDMSILLGDFFQDPDMSTETVRLVQELEIVRQGETGATVRTVQALINARLYGQTAPLALDGVFGPRTFGLVKILQADIGITDDGVVGPQTWPVLLGVA